MDRRREDLAIAAGWSGAAAFATACLFPYLRAMAPQVEAALAKARLPIPAIIALQAAQAGVVCFVFAWAGLRLGARVGLDSPVARSIVRRRPVIGRSLLAAAVVGFGCGLIVVVVDRLAFTPWMPPARMQTVHAIARWKGLLASFYGGIVEELQLRLFLMSTVAWALSKIRVRHEVGIAIVVSAVMFAAAHLPAAAGVWPLTPIVILRVMILNAALGIPFGIAYGRFGFEHAVAAHFAADLALHAL